MGLGDCRDLLGPDERETLRTGRESPAVQEDHARRGVRAQRREQPVLGAAVGRAVERGVGQREEGGESARRAGAGAGGGCCGRV
ncbi:hypothetical protein NKG05_03815 [Oerskovia sp. M15]